MSTIIVLGLIALLLAAPIIAVVVYARHEARCTEAVRLTERLVFLAVTFFFLTLVPFIERTWKGASQAYRQLLALLRWGGR